MKTVAILAVLLIAVNAIPLKPDDMPRRIKQAEIDSNKDLDEFVSAWNEKDKDTILDLTTFIIKIAKSGYEHSVQLNKTIKKTHPLLVKLAHSKHTWAMKLVAAILDGNRDNESYYDLETVIQWIQKRQDKGVKNDDLAAALAAAKSSQDHLQTMAWTFVQALKTLRQDASNMTAVMDESAEAIAVHGDPFIAKYGEAMDSLYAFEHSQM